MLCQRYTRLIINLNLRKTNSLKFNECYGNTIIKFKRFSIWSLGSRNYLVLYSFKYLLCVARCLKWRLCRPESSVKWSDPGHFLGSQGNFFCHFHVSFFYMFLTPKITDEILKSFLGRSILHYYHFCNI